MCEAKIIRNRERTKDVVLIIYSASLKTRQMAFWNTNLGRGSQIDTILDKEDVTLAEVRTVQTNIQIICFGKRLECYDR